MEITLGKRIANLRKEKGLTQEALAEKLNVRGQAVSKWEKDKTCPDISILPELAKILGVSIDKLLTGKDEAEPIVQLISSENKKNYKDMMLRIIVDSADGDKVRVNLPLVLVEAALEMGMELPQMTGSDALKNINFAEILVLAQQGVAGNLVEVESSDGDTVRIFVE